MSIADTDALKERIARALYENAEYYGPEDVQPAWEHRDDEERDEWREIAAAVLPVVAAEVRAACEKAWDKCAEKSAQWGATGRSSTRWLSSINLHRETGDQR